MAFSQNVKNDEGTTIDKPVLLTHPAEGSTEKKTFNAPSTNSTEQVVPNRRKAGNAKPSVKPALSGENGGMPAKPTSKQPE